MNRFRSLSSRGRRLAKIGFVVAAFSLIAVPAFALADEENPSGEYIPQEPPPSYTGEENPGAEYIPAGVPPDEVPVEDPPPPEGLPPEPAGTPPGYTGEENPGDEYIPAGVPYSATDNPGSDNVPDGTPPGYNGNENPGVEHRPSWVEARALGRDECQDLKNNFADNKQQFGECIAGVAKAIHAGLTPRKACASQNLNRKPENGEHRSDFSACVIAAAKALREQANS